MTLLAPLTCSMLTGGNDETTTLDRSCDRVRYVDLATLELQRFGIIVIPNSLPGTDPVMGTVAYALHDANLLN